MLVFFWGLVLIIALAALTLYDIRTYRLPDFLTFPLMGLGLLQAWSLGAPLGMAVLGGVLGYSIFVVMELAYKRLCGRDGLGRGDAKLVAAGGIWCGALQLPFIILLASLFGLVWAGVFLRGRDSRSTYLPFGPFLAWAIFLVWCAVQIAPI